MKTSLFAVVIFLSLPMIVLAQDDTAMETLQGINSYAPWLITLISGYLGSKLTKVLKGVGWLSTDSQKELTKLVLILIGVIVPASLIVVARELLPLAEYLDNANVWPMIIAAVSFAKGTHVLDKFTVKVYAVNNGKE